MKALKAAYAAAVGRRPVGPHASNLAWLRKEIAAAEAAAEAATAEAATAAAAAEVRLPLHAQPCLNACHANVQREPVG